MSRCGRREGLKRRRRPKDARPHGRGRRGFDEVQTKEKLASADVFTLRLNGSDHVDRCFLSDFRWPTSARSGRRGDGRALRAVIRSVAITVRKKRLPYPFPTTH